VITININNNIVESYIKKIMGFAYSKTRDTHQAEDLAQEILCELLDSLSKRDDVENMDAFVYTISCYTWSNFLRRNKRHWGNLDVELANKLKSSQNVEDEVTAVQVISRLKSEIAYLNSIHRQITVLFYYENKTGAQIAQLLDIPHSTVRWHLAEIKKKLKVGIEMENTNYEPRRLRCGLDGHNPHGFDSLRGIGRNRLVDNICLTCYGKALTIEEIARTLSVAAYYIEGHIQELVYMDLLKVVEKNKYTTTFFISTMRHKMITAKYHYHNIKPYAKKIFTAFDKRYDAIKNIGFIGSDLDKDFVLWALMPIVIDRLNKNSNAHILAKRKIKNEAPKRKDGSQFWINATLYDEHYFTTQTEFTPKEVRFRELSVGHGLQTNINQWRGIMMLDGCATIEAGVDCRSVGDQTIDEIYRIAEIIRNNLQPTSMDKETIAEYVSMGYVQVDGNTPKLLVPFLYKEEYNSLMKLMDEIVEEVGENLFVDYIEAYAEIIEKELPAFITKEERIYHKGVLVPWYAVLYWLSSNGYLRYPTEEEAKRLCIIVWCTQ